MLTNALQARGAATESLIVNISRQGLIYIPAMFILGAIFHETGLIWAQPVADVLSLLLALVLYMRNSKRLTGKNKKEPLPTPKLGIGRGSVVCSEEITLYCFRHPASPPHIPAVAPERFYRALQGRSDWRCWDR